MRAKLDVTYLRKLIKFALCPLDIWSENAEEILLMIAAHESGLGVELLQLPHGPAVGLYGMEPRTDRDIWNNYLKYRTPIKDRVTSYIPLSL